MSVFIRGATTTAIYTLSLHDALPICAAGLPGWQGLVQRPGPPGATVRALPGTAEKDSAGLSQAGAGRSEEHTSELQSRRELVCRLLLEKNKSNAPIHRFASASLGASS